MRRQCCYLGIPFFSSLVGDQLKRLGSQSMDCIAKGKLRRSEQITVIAFRQQLGHRLGFLRRCLQKQLFETRHFIRPCIVTRILVHHQPPCQHVENRKHHRHYQKTAKFPTYIRDAHPLEVSVAVLQHLLPRRPAIGTLPRPVWVPWGPGWVQSYSPRETTALPFTTFFFLRKWIYQCNARTMPFESASSGRLDWRR